MRVISDLIKQENVKESSDDDDDYYHNIQSIISTSQNLSTFFIDKNYIRAKMRQTFKTREKR